MPATTRVTSASSSLPTSPVAGPSCSALSVTAGCAVQPLPRPCCSSVTSALHRTPRLAAVPGGRTPSKRASLRARLGCSGGGAMGAAGSPGSPSSRSGTSPTASASAAGGSVARQLLPSSEPSLLGGVGSSSTCWEALKCSWEALLRRLVERSCTSPLAALTWQSSSGGAARVITTGAGMAQPVRHTRRPPPDSPTSVRPLRDVEGDQVCGRGCCVSASGLEGGMHGMPATNTAIQPARPPVHPPGGADFQHARPRQDAGALHHVIKQVGQVAGSQGALEPAGGGCDRQ